MDGMEEKLGSILANPEMMQKIMSMAQTLNASAPQDPKAEAPVSPPFPDLDPGMLKSLSGLTRHSTIDKDQQTLLRALRPYLSRHRLNKLENAMRAARMASFAAVALNRQGSK